MRLIVVLSLLCVTGCSVGMAMSGKQAPNLGAIQIGSPRGIVELQLGPPTRTMMNADKTRTDIYQYEVGNESSAGRAAGHAVMDLLTLGLWEIVGTPIEASQGDTFQLMVNYDSQDKVASVNSVAVSPQEEFDDEYGEYDEEDSNRPSPLRPKQEDFAVDLGEDVGPKIEELAKQLSANIEQHGITRIAILPLHDLNHRVDRPVGNYLTDKLTNALYKTGTTKIVEQSQLDKVIGEMEVPHSGSYDGASGQKIGQLLGVDAVIIGSYVVLRTGTLEVNSRIITVETGEIVGVASVQIPKTAVATRL